MKRTLNPLRLARSPLVFVLAQVRFSAVAAIAKYVPEIQERLRHNGFPRFTKGQVQEIRFDATGPRISLAERYEFQDKGGTSSIILTTDFVVLQMNRYESYEKFEEMLRMTLEIVHGVVNLGLAERLGLRYVDWIKLGTDEPLRDYLRPGLLGLDPAELCVSGALSRFEFIGATEVGKIVIRYSQQNDGSFLPPDLFPNSLSYDVRPEPGEVVHLLDLDHFTEHPSDFAVPSVLDAMGQLHNNLDLAFRHAVTPEALVRWGNETS